MTDIGTLLIEADEERYEEDDFEDDNRGLSLPAGASKLEILKAASREVDREDRAEAAMILGDAAAKVSNIVGRDESLSERRDERRERNVEHEPAPQDSDSDDGESDSDPELNSELFISIYRGDSRHVRKLLSGGASYFARDRHGWTPLMWATSEGHKDIMETLIDEAKAKSKLRKYINAKDSITGWTALHVACIKVRKSAVKLLVDYGANKTIKNKLGETPLECLQTEKGDTRRTIERLLGNSSEDRGESKE